MACNEVLREPFDSFTAWTVTGSPATIVAGRTGTAASISGSSPTARYDIPAPVQSDYVTLGFAFRASTISAAHSDMVTFRSSGAVQEQHLIVRTDGAVQLQTLSTVNGTSATGVIVANTWYYIELQFFSAAASGGWAKVRVNGVEVINVSGVTTRNAGTPVDLLLSSVVTTAHLYDDLYLTTGVDCAFQGDQTVCNEVLLEPFNDLTTNGWTNTSGTIATGRNGTGLRFVSGGHATYDIPVASQSINLTLGFAYRTASVADATIATVQNDVHTLNMFTIKMTALGQLHLQVGGTGTTIKSSNGLIVANTWVYIELKLTFGNTIGFYEARINGTTVLGPVTATDTNPGMTEGTPYAAIDLTGNAGIAIDFDDLYLTTGGCAFKGNIALAPPVAEFSFTVSGLTVSFVSEYSDTGPAASYDWEFGDGSGHSASVNPSHTYAAAGSYTVVLTITDNDGSIVQRGSVSHLVTVSASNPVFVYWTVRVKAVGPLVAPVKDPWWPEGYGDDPAFQVRRQVYGLVTGGDYVRGSATTLPHTALRYPSTTGYDFSEVTSKSLLFCRPADHNTVEILWGWPVEHTGWLEVALVRSSFGHPSTPQDGLTVYRRPRSAFEVDVNGYPLVDDNGVVLTGGVLAPPPIVLDRMIPPQVPSGGKPVPGLVPNGRTYYYTLFFRTNPVDWVAAMSDSCLLPRDFHHSEHMWECVPPYYRWVDDNYRVGSGHLRQFLTPFGFVMDNVREFVEGLLDLHYLDKTPMPLLKGLGANYGLPYESGIGDIRYRSLVANASNAQHTRGTAVGLQRVIEAVSKYETEITGSRTMMLFPDDSDFFRSTGNWGGPHPDTVSHILAEEPVLTSLPWDKIFVARVNNKPPPVGRGVMRVYTSKADETSSLLVAVGDSRIREDGDLVVEEDEDTVPAATTEYRDALPVGAGITVTAGVPYGFSVWVQAPEKNFTMQPAIIWIGPSGTPQEIIDISLGNPIGVTSAWKQYIAQGVAPERTESLPEARYLIPAIFVFSRIAHTYTNRSAAIDVSGAMVYRLGNENSVVSVTPPDRYLTLGDPEEKLGLPKTGFEGYVMGSPQGSS